MTGSQGGQVRPAPAMSDMLEQLLETRHSCRAFRPTPLADEVIEAILGMAQRTPSWSNIQPWQVHVVRADETTRLRDALLAHVDQGAEAGFEIPPPERYTGRHQERRRTTAFQLYDSLGLARGDREATARQARENFRFFGAPHVALITTATELGPYGILDCGGYVSTFMLAARSLGVASIAQAALARYSPFFRQYLKIPPDQAIVCGISFGYPDDSHLANAFRTGRAPLAEVVSWVPAAGEPTRQAGGS